MTVRRNLIFQSEAFNCIQYVRAEGLFHQRLLFWRWPGSLAYPAAASTRCSDRFRAGEAICWRTERSKGRQWGRKQQVRPWGVYPPRRLWM